MCYCNKYGMMSGWNFDLISNQSEDSRQGLGEKVRI